MVLMQVMPYCKSGKHDKCPGSEGLSRNEFGGVVCECTCHVRGYSKPTADEIEREFWQTIKESRDRADFEVYLRQFPNGPFADEARLRLTQLKPKRR